MPGQVTENSDESAIGPILKHSADKTKSRDIIADDVTSDEGLILLAAAKN